MLKYLTTYCDINDIEQVDTLTEIAKRIEQSPKLSVLGLSRMSYIVWGFQQLIQGEKTTEQFMTMGDIAAKQGVTMPVLPQDASGYIDACLATDQSQLRDSLVLIDEIALTKVGPAWQEKTKTMLQALHSELYVI